MRSTLTIILLSLLPAGGVLGQAVTPISDLLADSSAYVGETVTVEGFVTQHDPSSETDSTVFYLKGPEGRTLTVRTAQAAPRLGHRFAISGPLRIQADSHVFLVERARSRLVSPQSSSDGMQSSRMSGAHSYRIWMYGLGGAIVLAVLGLVSMIVFLVRRDDPRVDESTFYDAEGEPDGIESSEDADSDHVVENDTLKMHVPPEDGWTVLPGRLVVKSGLDEISEIRFYTSEGQRASPITFGRTDDSAYEHVQLKTPSVSNWQAKVVYDAEADRCRLVNYAVESAKPTRVNGRPLEESESVDLTDGDTLEMGGIELEFTTE